MNHKLLPVVAAFLVLVIALGSTPLSYAAAARATIGPNLVVWTIAEDDQKREKGIIILGLPFVEGGLAEKCTTDPTKVSATMPPCYPQDLMSQHKLLVTYNGVTLRWRMGDSGDGVPIVACNVLEKDKVNTVVDPKTGLGKQFKEENLMTKLVDVSEKFACKVRWKSPAEGYWESAGVLDVYYIGPYDAHWIADHVLVVEVSVPIGRTVVWGSDIQDICILGFPATIYPIPTQHRIPVLKPELVNLWLAFKKAILTEDLCTIMIDDDVGIVIPCRLSEDEAIALYLQGIAGIHWVVPDALGPFAGCEDFAMIQRDLAGLPLEFGPDPQAVAEA